MRSEKGFTLVELLAVIVIVAIIAVIGMTFMSKIINNVKVDAHLANARTVLEAGILAHTVGEPFSGDFSQAKTYTLKDLTNWGYFEGTIKNPTLFANWAADTSVYDLEKSIVVVDLRQSPANYTVNLSIGGENYIFKTPVSRKDIKEDSFTDYLKTQFGIKN